MARRKSSKKTTRRRSTRRRGIGAINVQSSLTQIAGVLGGVALAGYANKLLLSSQSATVQKVAPLALGVLAPMVIKSELGKNLGAGMIAYGGAKVLQGFGLAGDDTDEISIGADDLSVIAGDGGYAMAGEDGYAMAGDNLAVLAGLENLDDEN
jgi:hypothetical protein